MDTLVKAGQRSNCLRYATAEVLQISFEHIHEIVDSGIIDPFREGSELMDVIEDFHDQVTDARQVCCQILGVVSWPLSESPCQFSVPFHKSSVRLGIHED